MFDLILNRKKAVEPTATAGAFLANAKKTTTSVGPKDDGRLRMVFGFDLTGSREDTWGVAKEMQASLLKQFKKFDVTPPLVRLSYFQSGHSFRAKPWTDDVDTLAKGMRDIRCMSGPTQLCDLLMDVLTQADNLKVSGVVYVGDYVETKEREGVFAHDSVEKLASIAWALKRKNIPVFLMQEGRDSNTARIFKNIANITGGRHVDFDTGNFRDMVDFFRVAVAEISANPQLKEALRNDKSLSPKARLLLDTPRW